MYELKNRKSKELQDNEVKVKVSWAGICGTDLHEYLEGPIFISTDKPDPFLGQKKLLLHWAMNFQV